MAREISPSHYLSCNLTPASRWKSSQNRLYVIIKKQKPFCVNMLGHIAHPGTTGVLATIQMHVKIIIFNLFLKEA